MKKWIALLFLLLMPFQVFAADTKVTALTADTAPDGADLLMTVDDVVEPQLGLVDLSGLCAVFAGGPEGGLARLPLASCRRAWKVA